MPQLGEGDVTDQAGPECFSPWCLEGVRDSLKRALENLSRPGWGVRM